MGGGGGGVGGGGVGYITFTVIRILSDIMSVIVLTGLIPVGV